MASIPLAIQTPQTATPFQNLGQLMQLRDVASQLQLRQAQIQQARQQAADIEAQAQQRNRDLADQNTVQQAMKDPAASARIHTGDFSDLEGNIQPKSLDTIRQAQTAYQQQLLTNTKEQNAVRAEAQGRIVETVSGLLGLTGDDGKPDLDKINANWSGAIQHLASTGALKDAGITNAVPSSISSVSQLEQWLAQFGGSLAAHNQAIEQQTATANLKESLAKSRKAGAEADIAETKAAKWKAIQANPALLDQEVDQSVSPKLYPTENARVKTLAHAAVDYEGAQKAIGQGAQNVADLERSVEVQKQTAPIRINVGETLAANQAGIQNQRKASGDFEKSAEALAQTNSTAATIKELTTKARSGDPIAAQQLANTLTNYVKSANDIKGRLTGQQSQGIGSAADRLQGFIGGLSSGVKIPPRQLDEIDGLTDTVLSAARQLHESKRQILHSVYGYDAPADTNTGGATVKLRAPNGDVSTVPASQADHYKKLGAVEVQ